VFKELNCGALVSMPAVYSTIVTTGISGVLTELAVLLNSSDGFEYAGHAKKNFCPHFLAAKNDPKYMKFGVVIFDLSVKFGLSH
jgi:hypothetical protein